MPFVAPGFKKVALPFIPATEYQMKNIEMAIQRHCEDNRVNGMNTEVYLRT